MSEHLFKNSIWLADEECFITPFGLKWKFSQKHDANGQPLHLQNGSPDLEVSFLNEEHRTLAGMIKIIPDLARDLLRQGETRRKMEQKIRTMASPQAHFWNAVLDEMQKICKEESKEF